MKKLFITLGVAMLCLGLSACGNKATPQPSSQSASSSSKEPEKSVQESSNKEENLDDGLVTDSEYFRQLKEQISDVDPDTVVQSDYTSNFNYKTLLRDPSKYFSAQLKLSNLIVISVQNVAKYVSYIATTRDGDIYCLFIEHEMIISNVLKDDDITVFGRFLADYKYVTVEGSTNNVPLIYIDGLFMNEQ